MCSILHGTVHNLLLHLLCKFHVLGLVRMDVSSLLGGQSHVTDSETKYLEKRLKCAVFVTEFLGQK